MNFLVFLSIFSAVSGIVIPQEHKKRLFDPQAAKYSVLYLGSLADLQIRQAMGRQMLNQKYGASLISSEHKEQQKNVMNCNVFRGNISDSMLDQPMNSFTADLTLQQVEKLKSHAGVACISVV